MNRRPKGFFYGNGDAFSVPVQTPDPVNHPAHYQRGGMEAIDVIEAFGLDYHLGNAVKYILRAGHKDDLSTDLAKARWYIDRAIKRLSGPGAK